MENFLIGKSGSDYVFDQLTGQNPVVFIQNFQRERSLLPSVAGACDPIFGLLDLHEVPRHECYKNMLTGMKELLLEKIKTMSPLALEQLLPQCFAYINVPDLSPVPMAIMKAMGAVPPEVLAEIASNKELYLKCSLEIQQQVWLIDDAQFKLEFFPLIKTCLKLFKHASWPVFLSLALHSNPNLPQGLKAEYSHVPLTSIRVKEGNEGMEYLVNVKKRRDAAMKSILRLLGRNRTLFEKLQSTIIALYSETHDVGYCCILSELLLALNDIGLSKVIGDQVLTDCVTKIDSRVTALENTTTQKHHDVLLAVNTLIGNKISSPIASVLADPATIALLLSSIWSRIDLCIEKERYPRKDEFIAPLTRLLEIGCNARTYISKKSKESKTSMTTQFYPLLMVALVDAIINGPLSIPKELEAFFRKDVLCRKIILFYGLRRLCSLQPEDYFVILELTTLIQNSSKLEEEMWFFRSTFYMVNYLRSSEEKQSHVIENLDSTNLRRSLPSKIMSRIIQLHFTNIHIYKEIQQFILFGIKTYPREMLECTKELMDCECAIANDANILQNYNSIYDLFYNAGQERGDIQFIEDWVEERRNSAEMTLANLSNFS